MREIVYIQAGELSNYTGTHFWNTQQSYFAADSADTIYDSDLSFREGPGPTTQRITQDFLYLTIRVRLKQRKTTLFSRLLNTDKFGALSKFNTFDYANDEQLLDADSPAIWYDNPDHRPSFTLLTLYRNGHIAEYRQDPIAKSAYHSISDSSDNTEHAYQSGDKREDIRYWSDFNQVPYLPRTVQKLPDPVEWCNPDGDWNRGQSTFTRHDEVIIVFAALSLRLIRRTTGSYIDGWRFPITPGGMRCSPGWFRLDYPLM
ncbi:hypothetical protein C0993_002400 [Termitomyces sp. T159_Od127]|nr:hypothetical protein C0993_002400 [Termitomyces sp. T159_Od127]